MNRHDKPVFSTGKPDHSKIHCKACGSVDYQEKSVPLREPKISGKAVAYREIRYSCLKCQYVWIVPIFEY